jgi:UDP-glucose 4-epimerase
MKILVTGGAGYIGSCIVAQLIDSGHEVVVVDTLARGHRQAVHPKATLCYGYAEVFQTFDGIDVVIHAAALAYEAESYQLPGEYYETNFVGTVRLLKNMMAAGVQKIVYCSSCMALESQSPYARSKEYAETAVQGSGLNYVILRYYNVCGADLEHDHDLGEDHRPETHLIPLALKAAMTGDTLTINGDNYRTIDGTCVRDYVDVVEVAVLTGAAAIQNALDGQVAFVGSGIGWSVLQIIKKCEEVTGKKIKTQVGPGRLNTPEIIIAPLSPRVKRKSMVDQSIEAAWTWMQKHPNGYDGGKNV